MKRILSTMTVICITLVLFANVAMGQVKPADFIPDAVPATVQGKDMQLKSGEYSRLQSNPITAVEQNLLLATTTWTEEFCSNLIDVTTIDNSTISEAMGFENFPPGTVINDVNVSFEMSTDHTWMSDVSIGMDTAGACGVAGTVASCPIVLFDGDGGDGGTPANGSCNNDDDISAMIFDDTGAGTYAGECAADNVFDNTDAPLPPALGTLNGLFGGTSPEDMLFWIHIADDAGGDSGVLTEWCMEIELTAPIPECGSAMGAGSDPVCPSIVSLNDDGSGGSVTGGDLTVGFPWTMDNTGMIDHGFVVDDFIGSTIGFPNNSNLMSSGCDMADYATSQGGQETGNCDVVVAPPAAPACGTTSVDIGGWTAPSVAFEYNLIPTHYINDGTGTAVPLAVTGGSAAFATSCSAAGVDIPAISCPVTQGDVCNPLPVELSSFESTVENGKLLLAWTTSSERNNAGFVVEVSSLDLGFRDMGFVQGAGTILETQEYSFELSDLQPGEYTVRLKQVDFDGTFSYSPEIETTLDVPGQYFLSDAYPNPFNPQTNIQFGVPETQDVSVTLHDISGRLVQTLFEGTLDANDIKSARIDGTALASGIYAVRIAGNSFAGTTKVVLQK